jgi:hypothetical protein
MAATRRRPSPPSSKASDRCHRAMATIGPGGRAWGRRSKARPLRGHQPGLARRAAALRLQDWPVSWATARSRAAQPSPPGMPIVSSPAFFSARPASWTTPSTSAQGRLRIGSMPPSRSASSGRDDVWAEPEAVDRRRLDRRPADRSGRRQELARGPPLAPGPDEPGFAPLAPSSMPSWGLSRRAHRPAWVMRHFLFTRRGTPADGAM